MLHILTKRFKRQTYFILFAFSGFSGLIYESIWTHYLKLFLGHAAYAQTLVLVIFMGGMAVGAWLAGNYTSKISNLLLAYAIVEGLIGVFALIFHPLYIYTTDFAYQQLFPGIESTVIIETLKWSGAALLILPQSVLLGMTFPWMSAGIIRCFPVTPGRTLSNLYFSNSLGAAAGVLTSGFLLIQWVGLPGTVMTAGLINLLVGLIVWGLCRDHNRYPTSSTVKTHRPSSPLYLAMLVAAAFTGCASFLYEIAWIRMLSMVLGASTHAFELMLSAFILGLALGGLWVRRYIDTMPHIMQTLAWVQLIMGGLAISTLLLYGHTFEWMQWILKALARTDQGYLLFNLFSHGLAIAVMLPTTFCAGMTLPLLTYFLISKGFGERSIGGIYAANTLGAIVGIIAGMQWIMPLWGVQRLITSGAGVDIVLGLILLWYASSKRRTIVWYITALFTSTTVVAGSVWIQLDPAKMASGVYLYGKIRKNRKLLFHQDGKTASIDFFHSAGYHVISTNGKTDAAIGLKRPSKDEPTMVMLAAIPWAIHPDATKVAVIGIGSGLTSHTILSIPSIESVDTVEIEPAMVEGARGFGQRVARTFNDPRSHIYIDDAKAFFTKRKAIYDMIISEPSNPWVSGVSGLFSEEFYARVRNHVYDDGLFIQWLHLYHMDMPLIASVIKALSIHFEDYAIYALNYSDIIIIARKQGVVGEPGGWPFEVPELKRNLAYLGVDNSEDLRFRKIGHKDILDPLFFSYDIRANSDYFPVLDLGSVRARFLNKTAVDLIQLRAVAAPLLATLEDSQSPPQPLMLGANLFLKTAAQARKAIAIGHYFQQVDVTEGAMLPNQQSPHNLLMVLSIHEHCEIATLKTGWLPALHKFAQQILPYLSPQEIEPIWNNIESAPCFPGLPGKIRAWSDLYKAVGLRDFAQMIEISTSLLPQGPIQASETNDYLLIVAMLSHQVMHNHEAAQLLWARYQPLRTIPLPLRLLAATSAEGV